jgi:hypothetical protein
MSEFRGSFGTFDSPQQSVHGRQARNGATGPVDVQLHREQSSTTESCCYKGQKDGNDWPVEKRRTNYEWAAAPFPSAVPGMKDVAHCPFDVLVIPRGARHPKEAFEFIAYVNRRGRWKSCA